MPTGKSRLLLVTAVLLTPAIAGCRAEPADDAESPTAEVVVTATPPPVAVAPLGEDMADGEARTIRVYETVSPAVVNIVSQVLRQSFFFGVVPEEGTGSGFLWDDAGHIVTNYHVVENANEVTVSFGDEVGIEATVVGSDPANDLAVLRVEEVPAGIEPIERGESESLRVGQTAIAIGNPFGQFERTLTVGVVSALDRTVEVDGDNVLRGVIQTDASINRGNSGGPLLDSAGRLIGVNTAIFSPSGTSAGVGLAIPVDKVKRVVPELIGRGSYPHPWLGVVGYSITPGLAQVLDLPVEEGVLVAQIYRGSPARAAGLRGAQREVVVGRRRVLVGGDILVAVDEFPITDSSDLDAVLDEETVVGQTVTLTFLRDGEQRTIDVTLAEEP